MTQAPPQSRVDLAPHRQKQPSNTMSKAAWGGCDRLVQSVGGIGISPIFLSSSSSWRTSARVFGVTGPAAMAWPAVSAASASAMTQPKVDKCACLMMGILLNRPRLCRCNEGHSPLSDENLLSERRVLGCRDLLSVNPVGWLFSVVNQGEIKPAPLIRAIFVPQWLYAQSAA